MGKVDLDAANASTIVQELKKWLIKLELDIEDSRGQCYGSARVMASCKSGVAATIPKMYQQHGSVITVA